MTSSSWPAGRSPSPTLRRSRGWPPWPARPTGSTPGCSPELCRRDLVPEIWLPTQGCGPSANPPDGGCIWSATGPRSRTASTPSCWPSARPVRSATYSAPAAASCWPAWRCPSRGPGTWSRPLPLIDDLDEGVAGCERDLRHLGADHPDVPLLRTAPGIAWVLGSTIAAELGDIARFSSPKQAVRLYRAVSRGGTSPAAAI